MHRPLRRKNRRMPPMRGLMSRNTRPGIGEAAAEPLPQPSTKEPFASDPPGPPSHRTAIIAL